MKIIARRAGIEFQQVLWFGIIRHLPLYLNPGLFIFILVLGAFFGPKKANAGAAIERRHNPISRRFITK